MGSASGACAENWLATLDAAEADVPWPMAAVVGMNHLKRAHSRSVDLTCQQQMSRWHTNLYELHDRTIDQWNSLAWLRHGRVHDMNGDVV